MKIKHYQQLDVWKKSIDLIVKCYSETQKFPSNEIYGLTSQIRRAAISIAANIAEGQSRWSTKDFLRHLSISHGSLSELETHFIIAQRLEYIDESILEELLSQTAEIGRMINGLKSSLSKKLK